MITYVVTDLFQSPARVLVNTVNTVGVMGTGIAKELKRIYPEMFVQYQRMCEGEQFNIGRLWLYRTPHKWILNFPTKRHWRYPSRPEYIEAGLKTFVDNYAQLGITSISFPLLGCGNGELDWDRVVRPIMEKYLKNIPIETFIHLRRRDPFSPPEHRNLEAIKRWLRTDPESLAFTEVWDDLLSVIERQPDFATFDDETPFQATSVTEPEEGILIHKGEELTFVSKDALLDLWQHIRGFGFAMERSMPSGLDRHARYVVALMARLPYLKPVLVSRDYGKMNRRAVGLQLLPRISEPKGALFAGIRAVERV